MKQLLGLAVALVLLMSSCSKTVDIIVKDEAGNPCIGSHVYILTDNIPDIEKAVVINKQWREQNVLEERLVLVGASIEDAKKKAKEQYDAYHQERPDISPYGYVTHQMKMEQAGLFTQKLADLLISGIPSGQTNAAGKWGVKLKDGDYYVLIEGSSGLKSYDPL